LNEIRTLKAERKKIKDSLKDELSHDERYKQVNEELSTLKLERKSIETRVHESVPGEAQKLEDLDQEIKASEELLSDLAFNLIMKNESIELKDEYENTYLPQMKVTFKKEAPGAKREE
jgi:uncharacterized protein YtpQ (UPF0354 family)